MISWGIVSAAFAFIPSIAGATRTSNDAVFYTLRLLLGACEAGFFRGIIFYLNLVVSRSVPRPHKDATWILSSPPRCSTASFIMRW